MRDNFFEDEIICGYEVNTEMKRRWAVSLDLLEHFMMVCEKHKLRYFAVHGTLLGAVRHKGFIPWDDDIDMAMPRTDFDALEKIAENEFKHPYFFQTIKTDPLYFAGITRLRNSNTTHIGWNERYQRGNRGCYIDILVLDAAYKNPVLRLWKRRWVGFLKKIIAIKYSYDDHYYYLVPRWAKKSLVISKLFSREILLNWYTSVRRPSKEKKYVSLSPGGQFFEKDIFSDVVLMDFEHLKVPVPVGYKEFAEKVWGGFDLPEDSKRVPHHGGVIDVETPYTDLRFRRNLDTFKGITDEKIFLFGAGGIANLYMKRHGKKYPPVCMFDNNVDKWGTEVAGITVKKPEELPCLINGNFRIIITTGYHKEIGKQLEDMGFPDYYIYEEGLKYGKI